MMTSYAVSVKNTLKVSLAPKALASTIHSISLNRRKKQQFSFTSFEAPKDMRLLCGYGEYIAFGRTNRSVGLFVKNAR